MVFVYTHTALMATLVWVLSISRFLPFAILHHVIHILYQYILIIISPLITKTHILKTIDFHRVTIISNTMVLVNYDVLNLIVNKEIMSMEPY